MSSKQLTDRELLDLLCEEPHFSKLGKKAQKAFPEWKERTLTGPMRRWLRADADRLGIQVAPSENLFSNLSPERQAEQRARAAKVRLPWEK